MSGDKIEIEGKVIDSCKGIFRVQLENSVIQCTMSGKIRKNSINILVGDFVKVEISPYDLSRGRITYRVKEQKFNN